MNFSRLIAQFQWIQIIVDAMDLNRKHFLQVNGTAMGTRVAPTYTNLFMAHFWERDIYL